MDLIWGINRLAEVREDQMQEDFARIWNSVQGWQLDWPSIGLTCQFCRHWQLHNWDCCYELWLSVVLPLLKSKLLLGGQPTVTFIPAKGNPPFCPDVVAFEVKTRPVYFHLSFRSYFHHFRVDIPMKAILFQKLWGCEHNFDDMPYLVIGKREISLFPVL